MTILKPDQGRTLVELARATIAKRLGLDVDDVSVTDDPVFHERLAAFVTLKKGGQLRGCIGNLVPVSTLIKGVRDNAINAAFNDYRFSPLQQHEFEQIEIDVSVLSPPRPLPYDNTEDLLKKLRPGIDGVTIRDGGHSATFLPQVWDQLPEIEQFLSHLCNKAGISPQAWRHKKLEIEVYQAQSFGEKSA